MPTAGHRVVPFEGRETGFPVLDAPMLTTTSSTRHRFEAA